MRLLDHSMRKERVFGDVGDGLYLLQPTKIDSGSIRDVFPKGSHSNDGFSNIVSLISSCNSYSVSVPAYAVPDVNLWHVRLRHLPIGAASIPTGAASISCFLSSRRLHKATEEAQHLKKLIQDYIVSFIRVGDKVWCF